MIGSDDIDHIQKFHIFTVVLVCSSDDIVKSCCGLTYLCEFQTQNQQKYMYLQPILLTAIDSTECYWDIKKESEIVWLCLTFCEAPIGTSDPFKVPFLILALISNCYTIFTIAVYLYLNVCNISMIFQGSNSFKNFTLNKTITILVIFGNYSTNYIPLVGNFILIWDVKYTVFVIYRNAVTLGAITDIKNSAFPVPPPPKWKKTQIKF